MTSEIDPAQIGEKIGAGGDRNVFHYGEGQVVKVSSMSAFVGIKLHDKLIRDYSICKQYFGSYIVSTMDATPSRGAHTEIQPYVRGEMLTVCHCTDAAIKAQLNEILDMNARMMRDGHPSIDLVGNDGMITGRLSNVFVDRNKKLQIIDATLLEGKSIRPIGYLLEILLPMIRLRQTLIIRKMRMQKDGAR